MLLLVNKSVQSLLFID